MAFINDLKKFFQLHLKNKGRIIKVTTTRYYLVNDYISMPNEEIKKEWFEEFSLYQSHATRDTSELKGAGEILNVEFLTMDQVETMEGEK